MLLDRVTEAISSKGISIDSLREIIPSFEDIYIGLSQEL